MATPTLPNYPVSYGSDVSSEAKVLQADFGDGYTQRAGDGLNNVRRTWEVSWENYPNASIVELETFLKGQGGYKSFFWTPPNSTIAAKWSCKTWKSKPAGFGISTLSATFVEEFDL
jgi:phage-related protein